MATKPGRARRASRGFTLVEMIVAALVVAIAATAVFCAAVSVRRTMKESPNRERMHAYGRLLSEQLKTYVHDTSQPSTISGPNGSWQFPGDSAADALSVGTHNVTTMINANDPLRMQYGATLSYTVSENSVGKQITINMNWQDPD